MRRFFNAVRTPAAKTTAVFYFSNFVLSFFRYLFHLTLLRFLTPPEYGEFLSYLSLMYLLAIPTGTIASLVTKIVADLVGRDDTKSINYFFYYLLKKTSSFGFIVGIAIIIFSNPLAQIFKAHPIAFIILGLSTIISIIQTIIGSFLAAFQKFLTQTVLGFLGVVLTIATSVLFIKLGFGATGAVIGQILAGLVITGISLHQIRKSVFPPILKAEIHFPSLRRFTFYSFVYSLGTMSLISTDILIVRYLFDAQTSGLYSSLSILGRMILFGLSPIIGLVLPMVSVRYAKKENLKGIFNKLFLVILGLGFIGTTIFTLFSSTVVTILSGKQYLTISHLLPNFALTMVAFALTQFILSYFIATNRPQTNLLLLFATIVQPLMFFFFGKDLEGVVRINLLIHLALFFVLAGLKFSHVEETRS